MLSSIDVGAAISTTDYLPFPTLFRPSSFLRVLNFGFGFAYGFEENEPYADFLLSSPQASGYSS
jgi:hypothetical protein